MAEDGKEEKPLKINEDKLDVIYETLNEMKHERAREKILSRTDVIYTVLLTLSTFTIGILISQRNSILTNAPMLFFLIGVVFSMIASFVVGVSGMIKDEMKKRISAYCLLVSLPIWYLSLSILMYVGNYLTELEVQITAYILAPILILLTIWALKSFTKRFERTFPLLFEKDSNIWKDISKDVLFYVMAIFVLSFATALIVSIFL
jgi:hypothetical protein